jgi:putative toxin-antitoxin system antitoxin component (TIGR02293 family)
MKKNNSRTGSKSSVDEDRFHRANKVLSTAIRILEDKEAAKEWISRKNRSLGGKSPMSLLDTEAGYDLVIDTLSRIEFGVVS